jgi:hypothetical protein
MMKVKILTVCSRGNVRSVTLRHFLADKYDVLACGVDAQSEETLNMLYGWADKIIVTSGEFISRIPKEYEEKSYLWNIGNDIWGQAHVPSLMYICQRLVEENEGELYEEK